MLLVILLHGVYGSHWAWAGRGAADRAARDLIAAGRLPPFALAMPSDGLFGLGSGYVAQTGGDVPSWVLDEVPLLASLGDPRRRPGGAGGHRRAVDGRVRRPAPRCRGRRARGARSPARRRSPHFDQLALFGARPPDVADETDRSVIAAVRANRAALPAMRLDCGTDDLLIEQNRALHRQLDELGVDHE